MPPTAHPAAPRIGPGPDDSDAEHDPSTQSIGCSCTQRVVGSVMAVGVVAMLGAGVVADPRPGRRTLLRRRAGHRFAYAALAVGALLAAITSGWLPGYRRPGVLLMSALMFAFCLHMLFGLTSLLWLALLILVVGGYGDTIQEILRFSLIQHHTPDRSWAGSPARGPRRRWVVSPSVRWWPVCTAPSGRLRMRSSTTD